LSGHELLKGVGYWRANDDWDTWNASKHLPDPRWLVQRNWRRRERKQIVEYLRTGHTYAAYAGYSYCRFWLCLTRPPWMGTRDFTDGEWVWPEGLAHYVERHSVRLPDEFVETMRSNSWRSPPSCGRDRVGPREYRYDLAFWVSWGRQYQKRPWYCFW
jgi:hypothetical protein